MQDIFIACVDGLKEFPEAIEAVYPRAVVQLCIVHLVRHSLNYVSWKLRAQVAADLRKIYSCAIVDQARPRGRRPEVHLNRNYRCHQSAQPWT